MDRRVTEVRVAEGVRRFRVVVTDDDSEPGSQRAHARQLAFLAELLHQPVLLACGPAPFEKMNMRHDGVRWVIELEAEVRE